MIEKIRNLSKETAPLFVVPSAEHLTTLTKGLRFKANVTSRAMDTANGGVLKYGGYHRFYGGHSAVDIRMWKRFGARYPVELAKDSFTSNGLPIPGVQSAARKNWFKPGTLKKWGKLNIGDIVADAVAAVDTATVVHKFIKRRDVLAEQSCRVLLKAGTKVVTGVVHGNIPLMASFILLWATLRLQTQQIADSGTQTQEQLGVMRKQNSEIGKRNLEEFLFKFLSTLQESESKIEGKLGGKENTGWSVLIEFFDHAGRSNKPPNMNIVDYVKSQLPGKSWAALINYARGIDFIMSWLGRNPDLDQKTYAPVITLYLPPTFSQDLRKWKLLEHSDFVSFTALKEFIV